MPNPQTDIKLSILICSLKTRKQFLDRLLKILKPQLVSGVEIVIGEDDGELTIGEKRNDLLAAARGAWLCFVDDDDRVSRDYVAQILGALKGDPDAVGFRVTRNINGTYDIDQVHSRRFDVYGRQDVDGKDALTRPINHLNPVRSTLARSVGFYALNSGEDHGYAIRLRGFIHSEIFLDKALYVYDFRTGDNRVGEKVNKH